MQIPLNQHSLHDLSGLLASGACTSVDIVESLLEAIRERDGRIHAYLHLDEDGALEQARAADRARKDGRCGHLLGIPIAVKDLINVRGQPCTCASRMLEGYRATYDATVIRRLRDAGAVFLGRTNMDEFAMGSSTENSAFGCTRNPWAPERVPGGSSGGSAAAVAAGEAVAALGSDTGGSIRQPAAFCGCVGLKPTYGRVSRYGLTAFASSLDQIGPITRTVRDAAILLQVIAGPDPRDATCIDEEPPASFLEAAPQLKGLRIGLPQECFDDGLHPDIAASIEAAAEACRALGARTLPVSLPHIRHAVATYYLIATAEASANLARFDGLRYGHRIDGSDVMETYVASRSRGFGPEVKRRILLGTYALSSGYYDAYYLRAQKVRTRIRQDFDAAFETCDVLLAPTTPTPAYRIGEKIRDPLTMYLDDMFTIPVNLAGNCALSVPCGATKDGLPIGAQFIAPALQESLLLRAGAAYEAVSPWRHRRPPWPPAEIEGAAVS